MNQFEKEIGGTFKAYRESGVAVLYFLNPPMRAAGMHGHMPCYVPNGKAPYDVAGYYIGTSVAIGCELKETADHEHSLQIVQPEKKGSGLQYHQLVGLVALHKAGGQALLLWNNGGEIGVLRGDALVSVLLTYDVSLKSRNPAKGSRSIKWGLFTPVKNGVDDKPAWLPSAPKCKEKKGAA